jgi:uncharacterized membrane protein (DUF4010 family)
VATKLAIAIGIGLLVGLEREWSHKDVGVRTFTITALFGALAVLVSPQTALLGTVGVFLLLIFMNARSLLSARSLEMTTSAALLVTYILGVLVGQGHFFTPVASAIIMTMLLAWKLELARFAGDLKPEEIRGAVLLGLIGFVIYPLLPNRFIDPWHLLNPRQSWLIVIVIAALEFANYVLLRLFSRRGLYYTAFLGGLVNSTATVAELTRSLGSIVKSVALALILLTSVAMFIRNLTILAIFAPAAVPIAVWPLLAMTVAAVFFVWQRRERGTEPVQAIHMSSPLSLRYIIQFGLLFVLMEVVGTVGARFLGKFGFLVLSLLGGMVSSASTTAAAATMAVHGKLSAPAAGVATVFASISSALVNLPLVERQTHDKGLTRSLAIISFVLVAIGLIVLVMREGV